METATYVNESQLFETTLLHLANCLTYVQAEKVAVQLKVDQGHISMLRRIYMEDSDMFAFRVLQKWWNACELNEAEARNELSEALKCSDLAGLARTAPLGEQDLHKELSKHYLMSVMENFKHIQVEHLAISLGVRPNIVDSLHKMYSDDPQLFGFHVLLHWRNSCELDPDQQKEQLEFVLASLATSTSFQDDDIDISEVETSHENCINTKSGYCKCSKWCRWVTISMLLFLPFLISVCSIPVLLTVPFLEDYSIPFQPGDSILFPVSNMATALNLKINTHLFCIGKAMSLDCSEIRPIYEWKNITMRVYIYMSIDSVFQFKIASASYKTSLLPSSQSSFVWVFRDYDTYAEAVLNDFQGFVCASPGDGNWCYEINNVAAESSSNYVNYTITKTNYYHIACYPDDKCPLVETLLMYQGSYSFDSFDSRSHSYLHLNEQKPTEIILKSQFDYSQKRKCVLAHISSDQQTSCSSTTKIDHRLLVSDQHHHIGLLVFPGLLVFSLLLCNIVYSLCFCYKIYRSNCRIFRKNADNYQLITMTSDV